MTHHSWLFCFEVGIAATALTLILLVVIIAIIWAISKGLSAFYENVFGVYDTGGWVVATWVVGLMVTLFTAICRHPEAFK